jgi:cytochrome c peroxidase
MAAILIGGLSWSAGAAPAVRFKIPRAEVPGFLPPRRDPAVVAIGERLFLETRFSQFFHARAGTNLNAGLQEGDPVMAETATTGRPLAGPFRGHAMNCRACHLVNEQAAAGRGHRTYADYARRSPIPERSDGQKLTVRNSPPLVNATLPREGEVLLHFDGEFAGPADLLQGTWTGRNFGWLPGEQDTAVRHLVRVLREDDGRGLLAREFGGFSYREVFLGTNEALGEEGKGFRLPEEYRFDMAHANDLEVLAGAVRVAAAYLDSLLFSMDERSEFDGSPYDAFLETNQFPRKVEAGMEPRYYNRHLADLIQSARDLVFVDGTNGVAPPAPGRFKTFGQKFQFGARELAGARLFFGRGNCNACHPAPAFTDFGFHNTGVAQEEYDAAHGRGAFARLTVPGLAERRRDPDRWLPPTARHPGGQGPFLAIPAPDRPGRTDLGLWNVFANPDHPGVQAVLREQLAAGLDHPTEERLLPLALARFKTPSLRGLAHSDPYLHNGSQETLEGVIRFYIRSAALFRAGQLRNGAPELGAMHLGEEDVDALAAFLRSLNEDYD